MPPVSDPPSILFVEDDNDLRSVVAEHLTRAGYAVTGVATGLAFFHELAEGNFRVAVIDLSLPDEAGEVLINYVRRNTQLAIVVLTARDTIETRIACYQKGAHLFFGKPVNCSELVAAVGSLLAAPHVPDAESATAALLPPPAGPDTWVLTHSSRSLKSPQGIEIPLSGQEFEVLQCLAAHNGNATHLELLQALYQRDDTSASKALEVQMRRLKKKISDATQSAAPILNHYGVGYVFASQLNTD